MTPGPMDAGGETFSLPAPSRYSGGCLNFPMPNSTQTLLAKQRNSASSPQLSVKSSLESTLERGETQLSRQTKAERVASGSYCSELVLQMGMVTTGRSQVSAPSQVSGKVVIRSKFSPLRSHRCVQQDPRTALKFSHSRMHAAHLVPRPSQTRAACSGHPERAGALRARSLPRDHSEGVRVWQGKS